MDLFLLILICYEFKVPSEVYQNNWFMVQSPICLFCLIKVIVTILIIVFDGIVSFHFHIDPHHFRYSIKAFLSFKNNTLKSHRSLRDFGLEPIYKCTGS